MDYIFEKGKFTEDELEHAIIELYKKQEYTYVPGETIHRQYEDILLLDDLRSFLSARYTKNGLSEVEMQKIINKLVMIQATPLYLGNREAFWLINEGFDLVRDDISQVALHVDYIDFDHPENNIFKVVNQYSVQGEHLRRPDLLVFINGIPIAICEFKTAIEEDTTIHDAWEQITIRYTRDIPKLMKYCFLSVISDGANTRLGSIFTPYKFYYSWNKANDTDKVSNGISSLLTMIEGAFAKDRVLAILRDFVFYPDDSKKDEAIVCRYPQFFGAHKMLDSVREHMRPEGDGKGGTYFGATGCGKTYTMLFLSRLIALRDNEAFKNPTIVILEDREDLDTQTSELFVTAKKYLHQSDVRSIESREDMEKTLREKPSGGVYITTIQKFCEKTGLLSDRSNIICISDEAHRTQTGVGAKLKKTDKGVFTTYGFAKYLRDALPNATYVGFTGTPIDETIHVFGDVVDQYTMRESEDDGITVPIKYDPRLARVFLNKEQADKVEEYYRLCADEGATPEDIAKSKAAMSSMEVIIGDEDVLRRVAKDIIDDYKRRTETTDRLQKAMITCADRTIAFRLYKIMRELQPDWFDKKKALNELVLTADEKAKLNDIAFVNMVMTRDKDDEKELYNLLGDKEYRKFLDTEFKSEKSNFHISINVDMWITGFDVPCLTMLYNDKPLSKHTLIQTISRVNRRYGTKEFGFIIDYIGIREEMKKAMKKYGGDVGPQEDLEAAHDVLKNELQLLQERLSGLVFDRFFGDNDLARLQFIQEAAEYILANSVERKGEVSFLKLFKEHVKRLRSAYNICNPAGILTDEEIAWSQCFMGICSYVNKMTATEHDTESMNRHVEQMIQEAILASGVERVMNEGVEENIFSDSFTKEVDEIKMPFTKFQILCKLVVKAIRAYGRTNKIQAEHFQKMLEETIDAYNTRDKLTFTNDVTQNVVNDVYDIVSYKINGLSNKLLDILKELKTDSEKFKVLGITFEEKAFFDVLVEVRDKHGFEYADDRCIELAKKIKALIDDTAIYADWLNNDNLKSKLASQLTFLLYKDGYPPQWDEEVFQKVLEQVENYKKYE